MALPITLRIFTALALVASASAVPLPREQVEAAAKDLAKNTRAALEETGVPGAAVAVVFEGKVILAEGFGVRAAGTKEPVDADTVFQLASLSKPVGSTVVAGLVGKGIVSWDSRISDLDPGFQMFDPWVTRNVTLRDLYAQRSGLPPHAGDLLEDIGYPRAEILHRLRLQPPNSSFRSAYAYTNFGLSEAAYAAADAAGRDWAALSDEILYRPLGMNRTSSRHADFTTRQNRALGHELVDGKWTHVEQRQPDAQSPAGGVSSSVNDLTRWMRLQIDDGTFNGKPIIDADALAETRHPVMLTGFSPFDGTPGFYGLGWNVRYDTSGRLQLNHSGAFALGAATFVALVPAEKLGVVILTNASPIGLPEGLGQTFLEQALTGKVTHDWMGIMRTAFAQMNAEGRTALPDKPPAQPSPAAAPATYLGRYDNAYFGPVEIVAKDNGLALVLGPKRLARPLAHWDRDTFTYAPVGENANGRAAVTFTLGPDGRASRVWIENLDVHGLGTFTRSRDPKN
jgi:CubicO group peptidase (beta-lactamase class C family)